MVVDNELEVLKGLLKKTFSNIKTDISVNSKEIERLHTYNRNLEMQLIQLTNEVKELKIELTKAQEIQNNKLNTEKNSVEILNFVQKLADIEKKLDNSVKAPERGLTAQVLRKVDRNRKSIIKKKIISLASTQELTLPELKDILVHDQELCSKATFYRYFEDLKRKGLLNVVIIDDMNIVVPVKKLETNINQS